MDIGVRLYRHVGFASCYMVQIVSLNVASSAMNTPLRPERRNGASYYDQNGAIYMAAKLLCYVGRVRLAYQIAALLICP